MGDYHVVSLSGGKDSTAMLLLMLEMGMQIDEIVNVDTGMEFPEMAEHISRIEEYTGRTVTRLHHPQGFEYLMFDYVLTKGERKGEQGYGWARPNARWCTSKLKTDVIAKYLHDLSRTRNVIEYVGIAADEAHRKKAKRYPLIDWGVTEAEALTYCYECGFTWGGLYELFGRVSCWCCPLQSLDDLRNLRTHFPELWKRLQQMDERSFNSFQIGRNIKQLEQRFSLEQI